MSGQALMVQGTASNVGKSVLVAALCRIFRQDGFRVAPFKAQNMSNNSYVTHDGGEIGRAQAVQAEAAGVEPTVEMNPILLKPEADNRSQVVVLGKPLSTVAAKEYYSLKERLWSVVTGSLEKLLAEYDVVVIEGAGSPAEVNMKDRDMVNMKVAAACGAPVLLAADIDRGGVFASIVGTLELLEPHEREMIKATVINKFRGDLSLLTPGLTWLEDRTGIPVAGVVPYYHDIHIAEEDSVSLERRRAMKARTDYLIDIAVMGLPHISNFDDFDALEREPGVRLRYVEADDFLGTPDMVIIPGTKSTAADLAWLRATGLADDLVSISRTGVPVVGICGGYQMLGERILDPEGVESPQREMVGLHLLPMTTVFGGTKETHRVMGEVGSVPGLLAEAHGLPVEGYEIHMGNSFPSGEETGPRPEAPIHIVERSGQPWDQPDGAATEDGCVLGTYIHGLFHNAGIRRAILQRLAQWKGITLPVGPEGATVPLSGDDQYDKLAALVRSSLDMELVYGMAGLGTGRRAGP